MAAVVRGRDPEVPRGSGEPARHPILTLLRSLAAERPEVLGGHVITLKRLDANGRSDYVRSLRAFFDYAGDVPRAAESLFLHPNTLRYRLRRMQELTGLDLKDPKDRLVAELQLHLLEDPEDDVGPDRHRAG